MEKCPACGYKEPVVNNEYRGHIMNKYVNQDTKEEGMFNNDEEKIVIPSGEGRVAGTWVRANKVSVAAPEVPVLPTQDVLVTAAPKVPIPTNI